MTVIVPTLETSIALLAADLRRRYRLASADAIIYAAARWHQAELLTYDAQFEGLPNVLFLPKVVQ